MSEWISVNDTLPDDEQECLIMIDVKPNIEYGKYREQGECWSANWCNRRKLYGTYKVTHWMPLPEPPKGE